MASVSVLESLRQQIAACEAQLLDLRRQLVEAEHQQRQQREQERLQRSAQKAPDPLAYDFTYGIHDDFRTEIFAALSQDEDAQQATKRWPLERTEYKRYGRQLIMPEIGLQGIFLAYFFLNTILFPQKDVPQLTIAPTRSRPASFEACLGIDNRGRRARMPSRSLLSGSWRRNDRAG